MLLEGESSYLRARYMKLLVRVPPDFLNVIHERLRPIDTLLGRTEQTPTFPTSDAAQSILAAACMCSILLTSICHMVLLLANRPQSREIYCLQSDLISRVKPTLPLHTERYLLNN